jgi:hypothetical protein
MRSLLEEVQEFERYVLLNGLWKRYYANTRTRALNRIEWTPGRALFFRANAGTFCQVWTAYWRNRSVRDTMNVLGLYQQLNGVGRQYEARESAKSRPNISILGCVVVLLRGLCGKQLRL